MNPALQPIADAAAGLLYLSESDHPFSLVEIPAGAGQPLAELQRLAGSSAAPETQTLDQLLRNSTTDRDTDTDEQRTLTQRFRALRTALTDHLQNIQVYRFGAIQIDIFIIGQLPDGAFGGLRTKAIET